MSRTVAENAHLFAAINGWCEHDLTSAKEKPYQVGDLKLARKLKIAIPTFCVGPRINEKVVKVFKETIQKIEEEGHQVNYVEVPFMKYAIPLYQVIALAEASSNLLRFDGVKYGYQPKEYKDYEDLLVKSRTEGFGKEVKRRIMVGTYLLSGKNVDVYYKKALQVRQELTDEIINVFQNCDLILTPATVSTSLNLGKDRDPNEVFLQDLLAIPFSMSGHPSLVMPIGKIEEAPVGIQISAPYYDEKTIYRFANELEKKLKFRGDQNV